MSRTARSKLAAERKALSAEAMAEAVRALLTKADAARLWDDGASVRSIAGACGGVEVLEGSAPMRVTLALAEAPPDPVYVELTGVFRSAPSEGKSGS